MDNYFYKVSHSQDNSLSTTRAHFLMLDTTAMIEEYRYLNKNQSKYIIEIVQA